MCKEPEQNEITTLFSDVTESLKKILPNMMGQLAIKIISEVKLRQMGRANEERKTKTVKRR